EALQLRAKKREEHRKKWYQND
ncbi:cation:proton antiporter, partial [Staphylococcus aureus]|nr:cation:proton antiporter [Staphylococcus aureus]